MAYNNSSDYSNTGSTGAGTFSDNNTNTFGGAEGHHGHGHQGLAEAHHVVTSEGPTSDRPGHSLDNSLDNKTATSTGYSNDNTFDISRRDTFGSNTGNTLGRDQTAGSTFGNTTGNTFGREGAMGDTYNDNTGNTFGREGAVGNMDNTYDNQRGTDSINPIGRETGTHHQHGHHQGSDISSAQQEHFSTESNPLQSHHRESLAAGSHSGAAPLTGDESMGMHSKAQNAPGKLGETGENALGAIGFGGSQVERPKEDQGIGEKIAEFLGA